MNEDIFADADIGLNAACACCIAKNKNENESPRCRMVLIQAWAGHHLKVAHPVELVARHFNKDKKANNQISILRTSISNF